MPITQEQSAATSQNINKKSKNKKPRGFMQSCWNETETFCLFLIYLYLFLSDYYSERYYNLLYNNYICSYL